ncbi:hypothetical protein IFM61606_06278 [Aspergillus udagawae]|nr:hypothetical protein IFM51744_07832 [Aspergillus udagawae]GFG26302.1 hypothetical protein IFM61606_06278 [Aspergillus udagawae]
MGVTNNKAFLWKPGPWFPNHIKLASARRYGIKTGQITMDMYGSLQRQTPTTPYLTSDSDLEIDTRGRTTLYFAICACGSFYLILSLWMLYTSYCTAQDEHEDPHIYDQSVRQVIADKLNELEEAAPTEPFGSWLLSTQPADAPCLQYNSIACSICLDPVLEHHPIHALQCRHVFHDLCLERWFLRDHNSCPLCQSALVDVSDICLDFVV